MSMYWLISLVPVLGMVVEKVLLVRFSKYINKFKLCRSSVWHIENVIVNLISFIVDTLEKGEQGFSVFMNLTKAFLILLIFRYFSINLKIMT